MKKANIINFVIITFLFTLGYILHLLFVNNNIDVSFFDFERTGDLTIIGSVIAFLLFSVPTLAYASWKVFGLYIKHQRHTNLSKSRYLIVLSTLIVGFVYMFLEAEYYYYFGSIIILYLFYFIFLYIYDTRYVKVSQESDVEINDEVVMQFLDLLGGKDNIISVTYESSRLKVEVKDIKIIKIEKIKELGAKGAFIAGNKLQAMIGSNAQQLENAIKTYLSLVK